MNNANFHKHITNLKQHADYSYQYNILNIIKYSLYIISGIVIITFGILITKI